MHHAPRTAAPPAPTLPARRPDERAGDTDRERTADLLAVATGRGHLSVDELDQRLAAVWTATSAGELAALEADLPEAVRLEHARRSTAVQARAVARAGLSGHLLSYLAVMGLLVAIWAAVGLAGGGWYPWPVWPALGWGFGVAGHVRAARPPCRPSPVRGRPPAG
jgi:hypothetical protein